MPYSKETAQKVNVRASSQSQCKFIVLVKKLDFSEDFAHEEFVQAAKRCFNLNGKKPLYFLLD